MKELDVYVADLAVLNVKLHNLHWNVVGPQFKPVHEYLEVLYNSFFEKFDEVAEYQKMNGVFPKASLKKYLELSDVEEREDKEASIKEALEEALNMLKHMKSHALEIAEKSEDFMLSNMMEDHVAEYSKQIWFIESTLK